MSNSLSDRYTVALQGFNAFERAALGSFFRLATTRTPAYVQVDQLERCDFVVADADDARSLRSVQAAGRMPDAVFIGAKAPPSAKACLARPVDPMHIVRELDSLVELRHSGPGPLEAARQPGVRAAAGPAGLPVLGRLA